MSIKEKLKISMELFLYFFRIGFFIYGGGLSIIAQLQKDYVDERKVMTSQELLDIISVGRSLPGTLIGNAAYLFGYHMGGAICGIFCLAGIILPSVIVLSAVTFFYEYISGNLYFEKIMTGVRAAVVPILGSAALKLSKAAFPVKASWAVFAAALIMAVSNFSKPLIVILFGTLSVFSGSRLSGEKGDTL